MYDFDNYAALKNYLSAQNKRFTSFRKYKLSILIDIIRHDTVKEDFEGLLGISLNDVLNVNSTAHATLIDFLKKEYNKSHEDQISTSLLDFNVTDKNDLVSKHGIKLILYKVNQVKNRRNHEFKKHSIKI